MLGYFISKGDAKKLGLVRKLEVSKLLQKVFFVVTDRDIIEKQGIVNADDLFSVERISEVSDRLNKNYYDGAVEMTIKCLRYGEDKK